MHGSESVGSLASQTLTLTGESGTLDSQESV